jgi:4a-hydroxytetrahydrobiopterin dehydratase
MSNDRLNDAEVEASMASLKQWTCNIADSSIVKAWRFENFKKAIEMLVKVSELAESHNHHPEIVSAHTLIRITLWTHDVRGLTSKDFDLAQAIDRLVERDFFDARPI